MFLTFTLHCNEIFECDKYGWWMCAKIRSQITLKITPPRQLRRTWVAQRDPLTLNLNAFLQRVGNCDLSLFFPFWLFVDNAEYIKVPQWITGCGNFNGFIWEFLCFALFCNPEWGLPWYPFLTFMWWTVYRNVGPHFGTGKVKMCVKQLWNAWFAFS